MKNLLKLVTAVALPQLFGLIGSAFTMPAIAFWYADIVKSPLNPPNWVFAPVWTILYLLMGVAAFLVWRNGWGKKEVRLAMGLFFIQLTLNLLWSVLFFGLQSPGLALLEIIFLWLAILLTIILFHGINKMAGWLLTPYILWVSFAVYLNLSVWLLN
jgi:tryptophan-rich sensory protein